MVGRWHKPIASMAFVLAALSAAPAMAQNKTLTISWWGFNGDKLEEIILKPFRAQCGCELVFETGNNADRLNKIKIRGGSGVDVVYLTDSYSQIGIQEGLFQPVDRAKIPNINGIYELAREPQGKFGPAYTIGRVGIIYDSAKVSSPITSWNDLWREDLKRRVSLPGITTTAGPMTVLVAARQGGRRPLQGREGRIRGARAAQAQRGEELQHRLGTGEPVLDGRGLGRHRAGFHPGADPGGRPDRALGRAEGRRLRHPQHGQHRRKGAANPELAHQFINFILDPEDPADPGRARRGRSGRDGGAADARAGIALDLRPEDGRVAQAPRLREAQCGQERLARRLERSLWDGNAAAMRRNRGVSGAGTAQPGGR